MADSTQVAAGTPTKALKNVPAFGDINTAIITMDVTSYAVGGFPRVDTPPATPDETSSFQKFFESLLGYTTQDIINVQLVSGAIVQARYDDLLDVVKLYNVDDATGLLLEVADAVDAGEIRLLVTYT